MHAEGEHAHRPHVGTSVADETTLNDHLRNDPCTRHTIFHLRYPQTEIKQKSQFLEAPRSTRVGKNTDCRMWVLARTAVFWWTRWVLPEHFVPVTLIASCSPQHGNTVRDIKTPPHSQTWINCACGFGDGLGKRIRRPMLGSVYSYGHWDITCFSRSNHAVFAERPQVRVPNVVTMWVMSCDRNVVSTSGRKEVKKDATKPASKQVVTHRGQKPGTKLWLFFKKEVTKSTDEAADPEPAVQYSLHVPSANLWRPLRGISHPTIQSSVGPDGVPLRRDQEATALWC